MEANFKYILGFLFAIAFNSVIATTPLNVVVGTNKPPFLMVSETGQLVGIEIDLLNEALSRMGDFEVNMISVANKRLQTFTVDQISGNQDIVVAVRSSGDENAFFSNDFVWYDNYAITMKDSGIVIEDLGDLDGKSIAIWQNGYRDLGEEFFEMYKPESRPDSYIDFPNQETQNVFFWKDRVDVIIIDKTIFFWNKKLLNESDEFNGSLSGREVDLHKIFPGKTSFSVSFKDEEMMKKFNKALEEMDKDGTTQQIYDEYK